MKKKMKLPIDSDDADLAELFNQMVGNGSANIHVTYARYLRISEMVDKLIRVLSMFNNSVYMKSHPELEQYRIEIDIFCEKSRLKYEEMFNWDFSRYELNLDMVPEESKNAFAEAYNDIKKSDLVNCFIITCDRLFPYRRFLQDRDAPSGKFVNSIPGTSFEPFPFSTFNLKLAYNLDGAASISQTFLVSVLQKLFELSHSLYREVTSPDVNIDDMVHIIMSNLNNIRNIPELSRCTKAFRKIEESVELLKGNFNEYYRDFISTKRGTIMVEHFVSDVAKNTTGDPETRAQFFRIIRYYHKMSQNQKQDPKIARLFDRLNEGFKMIERGTENIAAPTGDPAD
jgi:hypothetical protein